MDKQVLKELYAKLDELFAVVDKQERLLLELNRLFERDDVKQLLSQMEVH